MTVACGTAAFAAQPLTTERAKDRIRPFANRECQQTFRHTDAVCFRWRFRHCTRISARHVNCQVVKYLRPGESKPDAFQVCRYWMYVLPIEGRIRVSGAWHFECNDRLPDR